MNAMLSLVLLLAAPTMSTPPAEAVGTLPEGLGLAVGAKVPPVVVADDAGAPFDLGAQLATGDTLVVFYRGGWCPYCNLQLRQLTERKADFEKRGVRLVAVSVDQPSEAAKSRAKYTIPFPVLADPALIAHKAFKVTHVLDAAGVARLEGFGIDVEAASGKTHHTIAVPGLFLVRGGLVAWAHADRDYKRRPSVAQILEALPAPR
jgi:peroxiredoxin